MSDIAFCPACRRFREYSVLPGVDSYGLPERRFCACGQYLPSALPEPEEESA